MTVFWTLLANGVANGALYFLMAAGLTLIFGLMRIINFAHGVLYLWGAYSATFLYSFTHSFIVAIAGGALVAAILGLIMEKGLLASSERNGTNELLLTMGVMLVLSELIKIPFGRNGLSSSMPPLLAHSWLIGHFVLVEYQLFTIVVGILVYFAVSWVLEHTRLGITIRAGVENPDLVEARGIAIRRLFTVVFTLGATLAGFAGALAGPYFGSVTPSMGFDMQLNAFIIVVIGGIGSLKGSLVGSLLVGVVTAFVSYYFPALAVLVNVLVMAIVLIVRPQGLFGETEAITG